MIKECATCRIKIERPPSGFKKTKSGNAFCSRSCAISSNNQMRKGELHPNFKTGRGSYRINAIKEYGAICDTCGYNKFEEVLEVHHKDENRNNNELNNLEVLCRNCHAEKHLD